MSLVQPPREPADSIPRTQPHEGQQTGTCVPYSSPRPPSSSSSDGDDAPPGLEPVAKPAAAPAAAAAPASAPDPAPAAAPAPDPDPAPGQAQTRAPPESDDVMATPHLASSDSEGAAPVLPAKSALRASRLLSTMALKTATDERPMLPHAAPHHIYLSSEEDVSSSADDFSDFDGPGSESEKSSRSSASARAKREDTARVVTVVFQGRPSIVELPRRSSTPCSTDSAASASMLCGPTMAMPPRPRSVSSALSSSSSTYPAPPRSSSMNPGGYDKKRPLFLTIDPFAPRAPEPDESDSGRTPKTPTAMLRKTLSLVKKRSRPALNQAAAQSRESLSLQVSPMAQVGEEAEAEAEAQTPREVSPATRAPLSYQDIIRGARRNAEATPRADTASPQSPNPHRSRFRSGLSIGRPRSIRA